jgi:molecular chaperone Hsp33
MINNIVLPFVLNEGNIRGRMCKLSTVLDRILNAHDYPLPIAKLLGELLIATAIIGEMFKSKHLITLQIKSEGLVQLMIADYFADGKTRGFAKFDVEKLKKNEKLDFNDLIKNGILTVTLDQGEGTDIYQGIVALDGEDLSESIKKYFISSEQINTEIKIALGQDLTDGTPKWCGGGIMIQMLPTENFEDEWQKNQLFINTISVSELIDPNLSAEYLLYRLFHEEGVWVDQAKVVNFGCRCSRERFHTFLKAIPSLELPNYIVDGKIIFTCEFCSNNESFTEQDL